MHEQYFYSQNFNFFRLLGINDIYYMQVTNMKLIRRNKYMDDLYSLKNTPDIKIITGVRRCGKSFLMNMFIDELKISEPESNILRINFNDFENNELMDYKKLHAYIMDNYKKDKINYLFIV